MTLHVTYLQCVSDDHTVYCLLLILIADLRSAKTGRLALPTTERHHQLKFNICLLMGFRKK